MIVNNNISAIHGNRVLGDRQVNINDSFQRLSSGDRFDSTKFNSLSFGVSERMRAQYKGIEVARQNAADALSMMQTTDGFLVQINDILSEFKALAVQTANGIYTSAERENSTYQARQLLAEINRIASYANFNGVALFNGQFSEPTDASVPNNSLWFQVGENSDRNINAVRAYIGTLNTGTLNISDLTLSSPQKALDTIERSDLAIGELTKRRNSINSFINRFEDIVKTNEVAYENTKAAESVIRDTDVAKEITELTKNLVLNQVNIAMVSQANAQLQSVLRLLG